MSIRYCRRVSRWGARRGGGGLTELPAAGRAANHSGSRRRPGRGAAGGGTKKRAREQAKHEGVGPTWALISLWVGGDRPLSNNLSDCPLIGDAVWFGVWTLVCLDGPSRGPGHASDHRTSDASILSHWFQHQTVWCYGEVRCLFFPLPGMGGSQRCREGVVPTRGFACDAPAGQGADTVQSVILVTGSPTERNRRVEHSTARTRPGRTRGGMYPIPKQVASQAWRHDGSMPRRSPTADLGRRMHRGGGGEPATTKITFLFPHMGPASCVFFLKKQQYVAIILVLTLTLAPCWCTI